MRPLESVAFRTELSPVRLRVDSALNARAIRRKTLKTPLLGKRILNMNRVMLAAVFAASAAITTAAENDGVAEVLALLRKGHEADSLPRGVVVRVDAYLWGARKELDSEDDSDGELCETWEFTSNHVHRIVIQSPEGGTKTVYRRAESLPFDSKSLCKALLDGGIDAIATQEGMGEPMQFVGTKFELGHRSIEIFVGGTSALQVGESCACAGYAESNARAFALLYERLALQARASFKNRRSTSDTEK